jgi:glutamate dehydrogenase (NAD(P)+)
MENKEATASTDFDTQTPNLNHLCKEQLARAGKTGDFDQEFINVIFQPKNEIIVNFPVKLDDGTVHIFKGYRIQHNNLLGPYKGGLRFHQDVRLDECKALAFWMSIKCSLQNLPLGGAKGGIKFNPREFSDSDVQKIADRFGQSLYKYIGPHRDIPAPDVGTNSKIMDVMTSAYRRIMKTHENAAYTGKSLIYGGSEGREEATGRGVMMCLKSYFKHLNEPMQDKTYIIQGFGNVGSFAATFLDELGMKCIGVGDHTGYYMNKGGFNINELVVHNKKNRSLKGYVETTCNKKEFFATKCNVVVLAALELQICGDDANDLNCDVIIEGANGPIDTRADDILTSKGIPVIPDVLANSGGVIVSYYEWLQNNRKEYWELEDVRTKLEKKMIKTFDLVYTHSKENNTSLRTSSYIKALRNLEYTFHLQNNF